MPATSNSRILKNVSDGNNSFAHSFLASPLSTLPEGSKEGSSDTSSLPVSHNEISIATSSFSHDTKSVDTRNLSDRNSSDLRPVFSEISLVKSSFSHNSGSPARYHSFTDTDNDLCNDVRRRWHRDSTPTPTENVL